jgi:hypothetical protein
MRKWKLEQVYKLRLNTYPKPEWELLQKQTCVLSKNDIAAGFPDHTWGNLTNLGTRILTTAFKKAVAHAEIKTQGGSFVIEVHHDGEE